MDFKFISLKMDKIASLCRVLSFRKKFKKGEKSGALTSNPVG